MNRQLEHHEVNRLNKYKPVCLLLDDIDSPSNVGSLFRLADALGVEKIFLSGKTPRPPNKKLTRAARSTEKYVNFKFYDQVDEAIQELKQRGYSIIALEMTTKSIALNALDFSVFDKVCIIPGNENDGVSDRILQHADYTVHIPMQGQNSSMNIATATAIALYQITTHL